eukprot:scaffold13751_cov108-Isochrysis_galbana.AAC.2
MSPRVRRLHSFPPSACGGAGAAPPPSALRISSRDTLCILAWALSERWGSGVAQIYQRDSVSASASASASAHGAI